MTSVIFKESEKSVELDGHTSDPIVCHALSGIVDTAFSFCEEKCDAIVLHDDEEAHMKMIRGEKSGFFSGIMYACLFAYIRYAIEKINESYPGNIRIFTLD